LNSRYSFDKPLGWNRLESILSLPAERK